MAFPSVPSANSARSWRAARKRVAASRRSSKRGSRVSRRRQPGTINPSSRETAPAASDSSRARDSSAEPSSSGSSRGTGFGGGTSYTWRKRMTVIYDSEVPKTGPHSSRAKD